MAQQMHEGICPWCEEYYPSVPKHASKIHTEKWREWTNETTLVRAEGARVWCPDNAKVVMDVDIEREDETVYEKDGHSSKTIYDGRRWNGGEQ